MRKIKFLVIAAVSILGLSRLNLVAQTGPSLDLNGKEATLVKPESKINKYRDLELTIKIRRLLSEDPEFSQ